MGESGGAPPTGQRPLDVRKPTVPVSAAGERHEPPESLPSAHKQLPSHNETPAPELDPPLMRRAVASQGLRGAPQCWLTPITPNANGTLCDLPGNADS